MAAEIITGTVDSYTSEDGNADGDIAVAIDIDSDCEMTVAICWGANGAAQVFDQLYWNSNSSGIQTGWTQVGSAGSSSCPSVDVYYMLESHANHPAAGTGSQTLYSSFNDDQGWERGGVVTFQVKNVAASGYIVSTDGLSNDSDTTSWTGSLTGQTADDLTIICATSYNENIDGGNHASMTELSGSDFAASQSFAIGYGTNISAPSIGWAGSDEWWSAFAFGINGTSGVSSTTIDVTAGLVTVAGANPSVYQDTLISIGAGSVTVAGLNPAINVGTTITVTAGSITVAGLNPTVYTDTLIGVTAGAVTVTPANLSVYQDTLISCTAGAVIVTPANPSIYQATLIDVTAGAVTITGYNPTIGTSDPNTVIDVTAGSVIVAGANPSVYQDTLISCTAGSITVTGQNVNVLNGSVISVGAGSITVAGANVNVYQDTLISCTAGTITVTGYNPSVTSGAAWINIVVEGVNVDGKFYRITGKYKEI